MLMAATYGTFNPERWDAANASSSLMIACILIVFGGGFYWVREKRVHIEGYVTSIVDVHELSQKRYIDYMLAHYGNVASVATFCAALIYVMKRLLPYAGITTTSILMSLAASAVFLLYGFVFAKAVFGALHRSGFVFFSLLAMLLFDVVLIQMAIQGVASL
ncbi:hypothetical protein RBH03_17220 [Pseudomonas aeruginosa]|uniref:hypothetical protein n=1 Tax=Pseudomonas aeruginosa TaxID=287 RepID=UPI00280B8033|nr:hypothetical protein [Pseudomonas aeruginosa]WME44896.1 hypothetical protein RBH03_17220 [Pseudomonas aeruginosa]